MSEENNYSLKEMIQELRNDNKQAITTQAVIVSTLESINTHLANMNKKIEDQETRLNEFDVVKGKAMLIWGGIVVIATSAVNHFLKL